MARLRTPAPTSAPPALADLARMWRDGLNRSHNAGCGCGGMSMPALSATDMEADFLDYLHTRYLGQQRTALAQCIDARRTDVTRETISNAFERWISNLDSAPLNADDAMQLRADIATFVVSMNSGSARPGICY